MIEIVTLGVQTQGDIILFLAAHKDAVGMHLAFLLPVAGQECLQGALVVHGQDDHRLAWVDAGLGVNHLKDAADQLELLRSAPGLLLVAIGNESEVRAAKRQPGLRLRRSQGRKAGEQQ